MAFSLDQKELVRLDGGMGTLLQARGLKPGETPEDWNVKHPEDVLAIHRAYVEAGAQVIYTNTFGANPLKYHGRHSLAEVIRGALEIAKKANAKVALDLGPTGKLLKPAGDLSFDDAVAAFAETIKIATSTLQPDLVAIETMSDLHELKAAVLAAKEGCDLPIYATVTLGADGRLLTGASVESVAMLLESLDVAAYGFNCGLGPKEMLPYVKRLAQFSTKPIIVKPNAGLPKVIDGKTIFTVGPDEFAADVAQLVAAGASIIGGCCGTTPKHIEKSSNGRMVEWSNRQMGESSNNSTTVSSGVKIVELKPYEGLIIGERINPTGKKLLKEAYAKGDTAYILREAIKQVDAGAKILDVNCGVPGLDEVSLLKATVENVQSVVNCPIQIDTSNPEALKTALRQVNGRPLVNSVNGKRESMDTVFPLVKKYGGIIVALCLDEKGIPSTSDGRLAIAQRILDEGAKYGFTKKDFIFDALTLAVSADKNAAVITLETVKRLTEELKVNTILGVSNVSFGLPNRPVLNNTMFALAKRAGLSAAIANPAVIKDEINPAAQAVLLGRDENCANWIASNVNTPAANSNPTSTLSDSVLTAAIRRGLHEDARLFAEELLRNGATAISVIDQGIVPALESIGKEFEQGIAYLPQLLMAAEAAGAAFGAVKAAMKAGKALSSSSRPIVLATVKGDIHDIGKNIVRALLENYGFEVIDLGRDVPPEKIVEAAREHQAALVGLSALMTTTVGAMAETIQLLRSAKLNCKIVVGGAVVTQEFADSIGADFYAKDAMQTVRIAQQI